MSRKRILTPTEQINSLFGIYDLKTEDQESDYYSSNQSTDDNYQPVRKRLSTKADLWGLFNNGNSTHYFCGMCEGNKQAFKKPASSTVAMRHVRRFHLDHPRVQELLRINPDFLQSSGSGNGKTDHSPAATSTAHFDVLPLQLPKSSSIENKRPKQIQFESCLAKLLSLPNMPIELAVSNEMRDLFQCLDQKMQMPSTVEQLKDILGEQSNEIRQCLNGELAVFKGSLSATIGVWKMEEPFGLHSIYVTVIVHFINDDRLQHRFLGGQKLAPNETVAQIYRKLLASYELDLTDIYRTCVNGSSVIVDSFINYDENTSITASKYQLDSPVHNSTNKQKYKPLKSVCLNTDLFEKASPHEHINQVVEDLDDAQCHPCISHDLKLILFNIVCETLIRSTEFQRMISLFQLFQNSTDAMTSLSETVGQLFIPIEKTEWSSWISALEYYCQHKHLLAQIAIQHNWEQLKDEENELLKGYLSITSVFRSSIKTLENNETPTVSWVYGIVRAINEKVNTDNKNLSIQIQKMCKVAAKEMQKLAYVQEDPIFVISTFLDPATKRHLKQSDVAKAIELIADWLKVEDAELSMINMSQQEEKSSGEDPLLQMLDSFGPRQNDLTSFVRSFSELICAEYQRQPDRGKYSATTLRILQNAASDARYEGIINIAKIVLAVPTSNVGLESEFVQKHHHSQAKGSDMLDAKLRIYLNNCY